MVKQFFLTIVTVGVLIITGWAQETETNYAFVSQLGGDNTISFNNTIQVNDVFLRQSGQMNAAEVSQRQGAAGGNLALLQQEGVFEQIILNQSGSNNQANFQQYGRSNNINVGQRGNFISATVLQSGMENNVLMEIGGNNKNITIIQHGNNWGVIDIGFNPDNPGYRIEQTGAVGIPMTIEHH